MTFVGPVVGEMPTDPFGWAPPAVPVQAVVPDFEDFVAVALPELMRYGYSLTGNQHDAADLMQGVLEKLVSKWPSLQDKGIDPYGYVKRAMANAHISRWRRRRRERLVDVVPDRIAPARPDRLENEPLWQALRDLPPRQRAVIVLRYYENLSEEEIAETLGVRCGTVKSQASKAMKTLRAGSEISWRRCPDEPRRRAAAPLPQRPA